MKASEGKGEGLSIIILVLVVPGTILYSMNTTYSCEISLFSLPVTVVYHTIIATIVL